MPGMVVSVKVAAGDKVEKNDPLLTMEAMKMETTIYSEEEGEIAEVLVKSGESVKTKDLLIIFKV